MNLNPLFKPISPLYVWFWFMQMLIGLCIVSYWVQMPGAHPLWLANRASVAAVTTILFVVSNVLILRRRVIGVIGAIVCWLVCLLLTVPTL